MAHSQIPNSPAPTECPCVRCLQEAKIGIWWMVVCDTCGNKRCPHATDHNFACTNSNEPGQTGSMYAAVPPWRLEELQEELKDVKETAFVTEHTCADMTVQPGPSGECCRQFWEDYWNALRE